MVEDQDSVDTHLKLQSYRSQGDPWGKEEGCVPFTTLDNHIRALWSLHQVTQLWVNSKVKYSKVVYVRPDVSFKVPLQADWILNGLDRTILIPDFSHSYGCNDRFAIGEPDAMKVYGSRYTGALAYSKTNLLHSEAYLFYTMTTRGFVFETIPFRFKRIRADGSVFDGDTYV